jgi:hypothetical protein
MASRAAVSLLGTLRGLGAGLRAGFPARLPAVRAVPRRAANGWAMVVRLAALGALVLFVALTVAEWSPWVTQGGDSSIGMDFTLYRDATARWLAGGSFYDPAQLAGPYPVVAGVILYPPPMLLLFVPFLVLPGWLWWAIPVAITAAIVAWHRPGPAAWAGIAACLWFPATGIHAIHGNPFLWFVAATALATRWRWPGVFVLFKPTLAPFALIDLRSRSWWLALGALALLCAAFAPMWPDYFSVLRNLRAPTAIGYSMAEVPAMLIPVIAWLGSSRPDALAAPR